jgi:hypothetical protein
MSGNDRKQRVFRAQSGNTAQPAARPLDPVIDFFHAGLHGLFAGPEDERTLDRSPGRLDDPTPQAGLLLLHVVVDGAMLHELTAMPQVARPQPAPQTWTGAASRGRTGGVGATYSQ